MLFSPPSLTTMPFSIVLPFVEYNMDLKCSTNILSRHKNYLITYSVASNHFSVYLFNSSFLSAQEFWLFHVNFSPALSHVILTYLSHNFWELFHFEKLYHFVEYNIDLSESFTLWSYQLCSILRRRTLFINRWFSFTNTLMSTTFQ